MQKLTLEEVKANACKAYAEKRLTAQHVKGSNPARLRQPALVYGRGDGCGCAIGVSLSPETLKIIGEKNLQATTVDELVALKVLSIRREDSYDVSMIQDFHDGWAAGYSTEREFCELIGVDVSNAVV